MYVLSGLEGDSELNETYLFKTVPNCIAYEKHTITLKEVANKNHPRKTTLHLLCLTRSFKKDRTVLLTEH